MDAPMCARCGARAPEKGFSRCARCRKLDRAYWRKVRETRRKENACPECGKKPAKGRRYCAAHLAYHAAAAREYRRKLRKTTRAAARK